MSTSNFADVEDLPAKISAADACCKNEAVLNMASVKADDIKIVSAVKGAPIHPYNGKLEKLERGPPVEVKYDDLTVTVQLPRHEKLVTNFFDHLFSTLRSVACLGGPTVECKLLHGVRGVLRPGTTTLIIGAPGSGKSALLRALAGRHAAGGERGVGSNFETSVTFNGRTPQQLAAEGVNVARLAAYAPQEDVHEALLVCWSGLGFALEGVQLA
jgi:ABC-type glutathione transport system ATPase component